jgi:hypothetical protein
VMARASAPRVRVDGSRRRGHAREQRYKRWNCASGLPTYERVLPRALASASISRVWRCSALSVIIPHSPGSMAFSIAQPLAHWAGCRSGMETGWDIYPALSGSLCRLTALCEGHELPFCFLGKAS